MGQEEQREKALSLAETPRLPEVPETPGGESQGVRGGKGVRRVSGQGEQAPQGFLRPREPRGDHG